MDKATVVIPASILKMAQLWQQLLLTVLLLQPTVLLLTRLPLKLLARLLLKLLARLFARLLQPPHLDGRNCTYPRTGTDNSVLYCTPGSSAAVVVSAAVVAVAAAS